VQPSPELDDLPGYRRRFRVTPSQTKVCCELEDDFHCMSVTLHHNGTTATTVEPIINRAPWTTCPGAVAQLQQTFTGVALNEFAARGEKRANCTHLHDLAVLAAAHAFDDEPLVYDILVSDPIDETRRVELRRNGKTVLSAIDVSGRIVAPAELAGVTFLEMRQWIHSLSPKQQEEARLLQWGRLVANGRTIPLEQQSDARRMPAGNCYTFQPHRAAEAKRVGEIRDFSNSIAQPLDRHRAASRCQDTKVFHP
jgi:hypothetical protein